MREIEPIKIAGRVGHNICNFVAPDEASCTVLGVLSTLDAVAISSIAIPMVQSTGLTAWNYGITGACLLVGLGIRDAVRRIQRQ